MALTSEQKACDEALRECIGRYADANGWQPGFITDYVLVVNRQPIADDASYSFGTVTSYPTPAPYRVIGLLHMALHQFDAATSSGVVGDDED